MHPQSRITVTALVLSLATLGAQEPEARGPFGILKRPKRAEATMPATQAPPVPEVVPAPAATTETPAPPAAAPSAAAPQEPTPKPLGAPDAGTLNKESAERVHSSKRPYSPYADRNFPTRPFFGDTHLHTSFSMDAGAFGCRVNPREAYRFARGEQIMASSGQPAKLSRPLDFLVVADHSDNMGFFTDLFAGKPELLADPMGRRWYDMIQTGKGAEAALEIIGMFSQGKFPEALVYAPGTRAYRSAWQETIAAAEHYNEPGRFTAFIGFEWTALDKGNNLHRNVIFRDNGDRASQVEPYTCVPPLGSANPIDLWKWMDSYEKRTGGSVLAIAHNGNLSNGTMFPIVEAFGKEIDREYAESRAKWERLYEATQTKGDGETGRRILSSRRTMSSLTTNFGTKAISTAARRRRTRCWRANTHGRH